MVKTTCTTSGSTVPHRRGVPMKSRIKPIRKLSENTDPQVWREKIASLEYSRDYSFLCPVDHRIAKRNSPPLRGPGEVPKETGGDIISYQQQQVGSPIKVEGLDRDTKVGTQKRRLVIRFRVTAEGKAQLISSTLNVHKPASQLPQDSQKPVHVHRGTHGGNDSGDKAGRAASLASEICKEIIVNEDDIERRERFKIGAPKWKRICRPKLSLGGPRLCAR